MKNDGKRVGPRYQGAFDGKSVIQSEVHIRGQLLYAHVTEAASEPGYRQQDVGLYGHDYLQPNFVCAATALTDAHRDAGSRQESAHRNFKASNHR